MSCSVENLKNGDRGVNAGHVAKRKGFLSEARNSLKVHIRLSRLEYPGASGFLSG